MEIFYPPRKTAFVISLKGERFAQKRLKINITDTNNAP
jgi:hypothetical protein